MNRHPLPLAALLLSAGLLAGCSDDGAAAPTTPATTVSSSPDGSPTADAEAEYPTYVAIGDSYTSAPLVPETDPRDGCLRSSGNYPSLVAAELEGTVLTDVSCAGADSLSLVGVQRTFDGGAQPPQLQAVTEEGMRRLQAYPWPGNIRELQNVLERACVMATSPIVEIDDEALPIAMIVERMRAERSVAA